MRLSRTFGGPTTATFHDILDTANTVNLHVYGDVYTQNNIGIANTSPTYSLSVGSNLYIDDTATINDNVLHTNGFGFFEGLRIGGSGLNVGDLITLDADAAIPMVVASQIQSHGFQTTGVDGNGDGVPSGIANTNSTNMLSFSDKIFINVDSSNIEISWFVIDGVKQKLKGITSHCHFGKEIHLINSLCYVIPGILTGNLK